MAKKKKRVGSVIALAALIRHKGGPMKDRRKKRNKEKKDYMKDE